MSLLTVKGLTKSYPGFTLDKVSFSIEPGYIMGFIGRNGAGKTTTMKAMLNLIKKDSGEVLFDGRDYFENEMECKQQIGFVNGEFSCYLKSKLRTIADVTMRFYDEWDEALYREYLRRFDLDDNKRVSELSAGMRVKFALALALSHNAKLLILDEPTSGLDPVSRDDLLDVFRSVIEDGRHSILFSTHIISDLEKCADMITYIKHGRILASCDVESFKSGYLLVSGESADLAEAGSYLLGVKKHAFGFTGLIRAEDAERAGGLRTAPADLESIMIYIEQEAENEGSAL
ncbi:MAG: ABC transporter ATP-binding protein [Clostridia bacterium]|nr:ABC transporter ATP-binding protein [Clostridia bacterium]